MNGEELEVGCASRGTDWKSPFRTFLEIMAFLGAPGAEGMGVLMACAGDEPSASCGARGNGVGGGCYMEGHGDWCSGGRNTANIWRVKPSAERSIPAVSVSAICRGGDEP